MKLPNILDLTESILMFRMVEMKMGQTWCDDIWSSQLSKVERSLLMFSRRGPPKFPVLHSVHSNLWLVLMSRVIDIDYWPVQRLKTWGEPHPEEYSLIFVSWRRRSLRPLYQPDPPEPTLERFHQAYLHIIIVNYYGLWWHNHLFIMAH